MTDRAPSPAHAYQEYFGPAIFEPLLAHVIELAAPRRSERAIDVACGTGIVTRALAERVGPGRVVGVDLNPMMIGVARSLPAPAGAIEWREGDGTALDLPDAAFDLACCQQGLQFFPDRAAGVAELRRVLAPAGRAVVAVWHGLDAHPLYAALADAEEPHLGALGVEITREDLAAPFSLGDADVLRDLLADAGFAEVEIAARTIQARFADAIVETHRAGDHVVVPMHANIAVARV